MHPVLEQIPQRTLTKEEWEWLRTPPTSYPTVEDDEDGSPGWVSLTKDAMSTFVTPEDATHRADALEIVRRLLPHGWTAVSLDLLGVPVEKGIHRIVAKAPKGAQSPYASLMSISSSFYERLPLTEPEMELGMTDGEHSLYIKPESSHLGYAATAMHCCLSVPPTVPEERVKQILPLLAAHKIPASRADNCGVRLLVFETPVAAAAALSLGLSTVLGEELRFAAMPLPLAATQTVIVFTECDVPDTLPVWGEIISTTPATRLSLVLLLRWSRKNGILGKEELTLYALSLMFIAYLVECGLASLPEVDATLSLRSPTLADNTKDAAEVAASVAECLRGFFTFYTPKASGEDLDLLSKVPFVPTGAQRLHLQGLLTVGYIMLCAPPPTMPMAVRLEAMFGYTGVASFGSSAAVFISYYNGKVVKDADGGSSKSPIYSLQLDEEGTGRRKSDIANAVKEAFKRHSMWNSEPNDSPGSRSLETTLLGSPLFRLSANTPLRPLSSSYRLTIDGDTFQLEVNRSPCLHSTSSSNADTPLPHLLSPASSPRASANSLLPLDF